MQHRPCAFCKDVNIGMNKYPCRSCSVNEYNLFRPDERTVFATPVLIDALRRIHTIYEDKGIGDCAFSADECCEMMNDLAKEALKEIGVV